MKQEKELRNRIEERIEGAEEFLQKAKKEKKAGKRNVLLSSACSSLRVALEILVNALYEEEKADGKELHLYEKIGYLRQQRTIDQGQLYKIERIRSLGNLSVHDAEKEISIDQAEQSLEDLKEIVDFFLPRNGKLFIRKHFGLYRFFAFLLVLVAVAVPLLIFFLEEWESVIFPVAMVVYALLFLSLLFSYPTRNGFLLYRFPRPKTFLLPLFMVLFGLLAFFALDILLPSSIPLTVSISCSVAFLPLLFSLLHVKREKKKGKD